LQQFIQNVILFSEKGKRLFRKNPMSEAAAVRSEHHKLVTRDETQIAASLFLPEPHKSNQQTILIASAMGIPRRFYRHYASYLAEEGFVVLSFDYRGIGDSRKGSLWGSEASMADWGGQDLQAALKWLLRQYPQNKLHVIGHSLGGHLLGLAKANEHVSSFMGIASQNIYWQNWPVAQRPAMLLFWHGLLPSTTLAAGYLPSQLFGLGEQVPKRVAFHWREAGLNPDGTKGVFAGTELDHFDKFKGALRAYSFLGDNMAPQKAVAALLPFFPNASQAEHIHISDKSVGHLGFFRPAARDTLWQESADWFLNPQNQDAALAKLSYATVGG
jgi:predicted alpha/beta hydrolase